MPPNRPIFDAEMPDRTDKEQKLIGEVRHQLGDPLADFLLDGYAQDEPAHRRACVVTARFGQQTPERRYVEMRGNGHVGLPRQDDVPVFAAVLHALVESEPGNYVVGMRHAQVLAALGREDTAEGRALVERALDRYSRLTLVEVRARRRLSASGEDMFYVTRLHPIVEYRSESRATDEATEEDASFRLEFIPAFRTWVMTGGLFVTEWLEAREVDPAEYDLAAVGARSGEVLG
jgi:hypothetical protein